MLLYYVNAFEENVGFWIRNILTPKGLKGY